MSLRNLNDDPNPCWERASDGIESLRVELENGEIYTFPYSDLRHTHFTRNGTDEVFTIHFTQHIITLQGKHLRELSIASQKNAIDWIRPSKQSIETKKGAVIREISVEEKE
jgi:hypothetical protein